MSEQSIEPPTTTPATVAHDPAPDAPAVHHCRARGVGAMGPRLRGDDEPAPPREVVDAAAANARNTGHRFDLMRYLRLRRRNASDT